MFNKERSLFLGIISMLFIVVFVSGCEKSKFYELDTNTNKEAMEEDKMEDNATVEEYEDALAKEEKMDEIKTLLAKQEIIQKESPIVFEDLIWKTYSNNILGYSIDYPTIANIMGNDLDQHVEFTGPLSNNEWWPRVSISHYSNTFYRPEDGANVAEWVKAFPEYELGDDISIDGLETVHFVQAKTPQAWAADYFYFIKDNQLYNITIIHSNDRQDWDLYNKMLESFVFDN